MPFTSADLITMQARLNKNKAVERIPEDAEIDESSLHSKILSECRARRWICLHGSMAHRSHRTIGEPDCVILADHGRVWFVELKSRSGKLSAEQLALKVWAETLGHTIYCIRRFSDFLDLVNATAPTPASP